jgi:hypothetical protein
MTQFERKAVVVEVTILVLTLIVTTVTGLGIYYQATRHFDIQRTSYMIERFNTKELVDAREVTDKWLGSKEAPKALMDRANDPYSQKPEGQKTKEDISESAKAAEAAATVKSIRVFCNFFQELGTAHKHGTVHEGYMWDVFGGLVTKYGTELKPFIDELRVRHNRQQIMQEFSSLTDKMKELDKKHTGK